MKKVPYEKQDCRDKLNFPDQKPKKRPLAFLHDDDDPPAALPAATKSKRSLVSLLSEDNDISAPKSKPIALPPLVLQAPPAPPLFFNVQTRNGVRVTLIDRLGKDWRDLLCYNWELKTTMHLKVEDLYPPEAVRAALDYIRRHLRQET